MRHTKRTLLFSALSIVLCVAMLAATTFAWFTDTASTGVNSITSGTLGVEIQNKVGAKIEQLVWVDTNGEALNQEAILWEPGCTYLLTPFKIVNKGNLALKYKVVIEGMTNDQTDATKLLEVIDFTYTVSGTSFDITEEGHLAASGVEGDSTGLISISAHMQEDAGNDYQGLTLNGIKFVVVATQDTVENDSIDNTYDTGAKYPVTSSAELKEALTQGGVIAVNTDVGIATEVAEADKTHSYLVYQALITKNTTLNFADEDSKITVALPGGDNPFGKATPALMNVTSGSTLTINGNGVITCEAGNNQVYGININGGNVIVNGGSFYGALTAIQVQKGTLEINGGFFDLAPTCKSSNSSDTSFDYTKFIINCIDNNYKSGIASITIKGGTFVDFDPSADPEGSGTSYVAPGYKVVSEAHGSETWYTVVSE